MPPAPVVAFSDVGKAFANGVVALDRLDLDVREGEFLTLLGPSGCGKSTALRMIAGLSAPSSGALGWREGRTPELGFVFQEPTLMPWANVWNNAYLPLRLRGISKAEAAPAIGKALALVGLERFERAWPRELWEGASAQRLAMLDAIDEAMKEWANG